MKILLFVLLYLFLALPVNAATPTISSAYSVGTVVSRYNIYDYAPSPIIDSNAYKMYWCSLQNGGPGDGIWYSKSSRPNRWTSFKNILAATPYSKEIAGQSVGHVCDPSVIKVAGKYYLYYTAASLSGVNNQIFLATSTDGITFTKYPSNANPEPVMANTSNSGNYGLGQSTVIYHNGQFMMYYNDSIVNPGVTKLATSTDGINFNIQGTVFNTYNFVPTFLKQYNMFFAINAQNEGSPIGVYYSFSTDGINWTPNGLSEQYKLPVYRGSAHNAGILTDSNGELTGKTVYVYYGAGGNNPPEWQPLKWDIDGIRINFR